MRFDEKKYKTIGFDIDEIKVKKINSGKSYIKNISPDKIKTAISNSFKATNDFSDIDKVDVIIICVPTPLGIHNEPDLGYIESTIDRIKPFIREFQLIVLESTTYPGTTEEILAPALESLGFDIGSNIFLSYSPEREDPGNKNFSIKTIPKIVSGFTEKCLELASTLYAGIVDSIVPVSKPRTAEMTKITENIHRAVNIGLINELKIVCDKMDIDIYEVIDAATTKPFGFTPFYPGPGLGGHCIPIDPFYLTWKAKEYDVNTNFIELAGQVNTFMPTYVVQKTSEALNKHEKSIKGSSILILGIAYKKNIDDMRESPSLKIMDFLLQKGALIDYHDPYISVMPKTRDYNFNLKSIELNKSNLAKYDIVLLLTDHDSFDYDLIENFSSLIIDTRGRFNKSKKVTKA